MTVHDTTRAFAVDRGHTQQLQLDASTDGFTWDEANIVQIDNPPHEQAFETDRFYKIPLTAARPVKQTYNTVDGEVVMKKPAEELRQAAWSLDNAPVTLGHPASRIVDGVDKIHGFTRTPEWDASDESLDAFGYVPVTDSEAKSWIEANDGVSIGFWYNTDSDVDENGVDGYQRDLLVDHVAIVNEGRCSREDGCGLAADSAAVVRQFSADFGDSQCSSGPCSCGLHVETDTAAYSEGDWVRWEYGDGTGLGRVTNVSTTRQLTSEGGKRNASEDNPAYKMKHWDGGSFGNMVVKRESELNAAETPANFESDGLGSDAAFLSSVLLDREFDASMDELDEVYSEWDSLTNMSASELRRWSRNPCSREASVEPTNVIRRNLRLLETNKSDWDTNDIADAKRTISFINRMRGNDGETTKTDGSYGCPTEKAISLLNWAYNPFDSLPEQPDSDELSDVDGVSLDGRPTKDKHWTDYAKIGVDHQIASRSVSIHMATASAPFYVVLYEDGSEHVRQNVSLGEQLGREGPYDAYESVDEIDVPFDERHKESKRVYAALHYADENGDLGDPIESQQGFVFDSAVIMPQRSGSLTRTLRDGVEVDVEWAEKNVFDTDGSYTTSFSLDATRTVAGVTFSGIRDGKLDKSAIDKSETDLADHYLYGSGEDKEDYSYPVVDADGMLRVGNVEAAYKLGARGGVDEEEHDDNLAALNDVVCESQAIDGCAIDPANFESNSDMSNDDNDDSGDPTIDVSDLTVDAIAESNEAVAELRDELQETEAQLDAAKEELDGMKEELQSYQADEKQELVDEITALTDTWDEDELLDLELDALEGRLELAEDIAADVSGSEVETDSADGGEEGRSPASDYESGEVYDLSDTA